MNFMLGKKFIVDVTENGIIPLEEFSQDRWFDKDYDDLEILTDEEKKVVINEVLDNIRAEIEQLPITNTAVRLVTEILDKYKVESEDEQNAGF